MHRLGVETTIFARSKRIGIFTSSLITATCSTRLSKELNFLFETLPSAVKSTSNGVILIIKLMKKKNLFKLNMCYLQQAVQAY